MNDSLILEVLQRLEGARVGSSVRNLVRGALLGRLDEAAEGVLIERPARAAQDEVVLPRCYLETVAVEGFRGIGPRTELRLVPGPGLTLVVGRNGSGKSSFSEAAEFALTGDSLRWSGKSLDWRKGWRNLHSDGAPAIEIGLRVEGEREPRTVRVGWRSDAVESAEISVTVPGQGRKSLEALGWSSAASTFRPFLPYTELSTISEGRPVDRYNALAPMLGMESLTVPIEALRHARLSAQNQSKAARGRVAEMHGILDESSDDRAVLAAEALSGTWDLGNIEDLIRGTEPATAERTRLLAQVEQVPSPDLDQVSKAAGDLRLAAKRLDELAGSDADRARHLAGLLEAAVEVHDHHGDADCPVCGSDNGLHSARVAELRIEIKRLRSEASAVDAALRRAHEGRRAAKAVIGTLPPVLDSAVAGDLEIDLAELQAAWLNWIDTPDGDAELAAHLESACLPLIDATEAVRESAATIRQQREEQWRPISDQLVELLPIARDGQTAQRRMWTLESAERWLKRCEASIRDQRFEIVKEQVKEVWRTLAVESNVTLEDVRLRTKKVEMDVTVDGDEGIALGVMSQGELNALALSLFIPRVRSEASPFRFAMLDDPVQAMDPVRVDGLARVLENLAKTHQVVVFTHDERLASSIRRLQIPATILSVTRRPKSRVELKKSLDPLHAAIEEARALVLSDGLPERVRRGVVPGLCRVAIEAACLESGRRRLLSTGISLADCEAMWAAADRLLPRIAIALYGDPGRAGDVYGTLNNKYSRTAVNTVRACNEMAHTGAPASTDLKELISRSETLAVNLAAL